MSTGGVVAAHLLADPLRARIVALLATGARCTTDLVDETGARQTTVSHHLRLLREAGWVEVRPCGRFTYYRLRTEPVHAFARELSTLAAAAAQASRGGPPTTPDPANRHARNADHVLEGSSLAVP
jgi:ArsR family transcriptional regulator